MPLYWYTILAVAAWLIALVASVVWSEYAAEIRRRKQWRAVERSFLDNPQ